MKILFQGLVAKGYVKETDFSLWGILCCRLLSLPLVQVFIWLHIPANAITLASLFFVGGAGWFFLSADWLAGGIFLGVGGLLDFCDGMVARRTKKSSYLGFVLDYCGDRVKLILLFGVLIYLSTGWALWVWWGGIGACLFKEYLLRICPYETPFDARGIDSWALVFGCGAPFFRNILRNDPWQLVLAGGGICLFGERGVHVFMAYYAMTMMADCGVSARSFINRSTVHAPITGGWLVARDGVTHGSQLKKSLSAMRGRLKL
jgi:hypothetical protein